MSDSSASNARRALALAVRLQASVRQALGRDAPPLPIHLLSASEQRISDALGQVSQRLADSYLQIKHDIAAPSRTSFAGTAHEVRELVATLLREKAPDALVSAKPWYQPEPKTSGPTHRQRVRYILEGYGAGSKEIEVAQEISAIDQLVADAVRAMYSRASDAAHRHKGKREVIRLVRYFDAFVEDLLNLG